MAAPPVPYRSPSNSQQYTPSFPPPVYYRDTFGMQPSDDADEAVKFLNPYPYSHRNSQPNHRQQQARAMARGSDASTERDVASAAGSEDDSVTTMSTGTAGIWHLLITHRKIELLLLLKQKKNKLELRSFT